MHGSKVDRIQIGLNILIIKKHHRAYCHTFIISSSASIVNYVFSINASRPCVANRYDDNDNDILNPFFTCKQIDSQNSSKSIHIYIIF